MTKATYFPRPVNVESDYFLLYQTRTDSPHAQKCVPCQLAQFDAGTVVARTGMAQLVLSPEQLRLFDLVIGTGGAAFLEIISLITEQAYLLGVQAQATSMIAPVMVPRTFYPRSA